MSFYEGLRDGVVKSLLTQYGMGMHLLVPSEGTFDPETGGLTGVTETAVAVTGVSGKYLKAQKSGTSIHNRSQYVYLSPSGMTVVPTASHRLRVSGLEYEIVSVEVVAPGGVTVLYQLEVREP